MRLYRSAFGTGTKRSPDGCISSESENLSLYADAFGFVTRLKPSAGNGIS